MNTKEILINAIKYPFSDWKKILILGLILLILAIDSIIPSSNATYKLISLLMLFSFIFEFFVRGYTFRIIKMSINNASELPKFNNWIEMFKDGIKVYLVGIIYLIPVFILTIIFSNPNSLILSGPITIFLSFLKELIVSIFGGLSVFEVNAGIWFFVAILYVFILIPIYYMSIANMAKNDNKFFGAFKIREIFHKIYLIGFKKLTIFYLATIIPYTIIIQLANSSNMVYIILLLTLFPYVNMYINRLVALFYMENKNS